MGELTTLEEMKILTERSRLAGSQSEGDKMGGKESWFPHFMARKNFRNKLAQLLHIPHRETGVLGSHRTCSRSHD